MTLLSMLSDLETSQALSYLQSVCPSTAMSIHIPSEHHYCSLGISSQQCYLGAGAKTGARVTFQKLLVWEQILEHFLYFDTKMSTKTCRNMN